MFKLYGWRRGLVLTLVFAIALTSSAILSPRLLAQTPPKTPTTELRGVWLTNIDSDVIFSRNNIIDAVNRLDKLNFNTIYPTVWQGGYTLYPSAAAERVFGQSIDPSPGLKDRDILKEIIAQSRQKGIAVIPWFEFGFMAPAESELATLHPDWLAQRRDGSTIWKEGKHDRVWLNPFHPQVQQFILDLILEIVDNYDIDGIQFDDHFGLPVEFGYEPLTVSMYQEQIKSPPSDDARETFWVRWRADKINDFVGRVSRAIKSRKEKCIVSLSPNPFHFALPAHLQDWFTWERRGYIQEIVLQVYRSDIKRFSAELEREEVKLAKLNIPTAIGILTGLKNNSVPLKQIQEQVQEVRKRDFAGVSFFFYESLSNWAKETPEQRNYALQEFFPTKMQRPPSEG
ncbi:family 10 glycosylhydrolase [Microcoleus vaginatus GB1-A2]|uniref:glycoside hydrolase family 10 protein n=1 Tax=Microcoleus vaginatus TaxID=119532 RepID=UPI001682E402|nr:glycoside hydrolase family 10 protein [Microcoleus sp. FACHB-61]